MPNRILCLNNIIADEIIDAVILSSGEYIISWISNNHNWMACFGIDGRIHVNTLKRKDN